MGSVEKVMNLLQSSGKFILAHVFILAQESCSTATTFFFFLLHWSCDDAKARHMRMDRFARLLPSFERMWKRWNQWNQEMCMQSSPWDSPGRPHVVQSPSQIQHRQYGVFGGVLRWLGSRIKRDRCTEYGQPWLVGWIEGGRVQQRSRPNFPQTLREHDDWSHHRCKQHEWRHHGHNYRWVAWRSAPFEQYHAQSDKKIEWQVYAWKGSWRYREVHYY